MNQSITYTENTKQKPMPAWRDNVEHYKSLVCVIDGAPVEVITARIKYPRDGAGRLCAIVWIHTNKGTVHGCGTASGYGYCKASAAIDQALRDAGYTLSKSFAGAGSSAVDDAFLAIAELIHGEKFAAYAAKPNAIFV
jgi:hypothetical protein